jgi:hypothetical protein
MWPSKAEFIGYQEVCAADITNLKTAGVDVASVSPLKM